MHTARVFRGASGALALGGVLLLVRFWSVDQPEFFLALAMLGVAAVLAALAPLVSCGHNLNEAYHAGHEAGVRLGERRIRPRRVTDLDAERRNRAQ